MKILNPPGPHSERIVVDEIIENNQKWPKVRLLRAKRLPNKSDDDLGIETWSEEVEDFISAWRVEAFVGFESRRKLREGDVFLVKDGRKLTEKYEPIERYRAVQDHLLVHWDESTEFARLEIKKGFAGLAAVQAAGTNKELVEKLVANAEKRIYDAEGSKE